MHPRNIAPPPQSFHSQPQQLAPAVYLPYPMQSQQVMMMAQQIIMMPQYVNPTLYSSIHNAQIQIRRVWRLNFQQEMENIRYLINNTPFNVVSMDTEYPGVIIESNNVMDRRNTEVQYSLMKRNVDLMQLIQVGLTISDAQGNLPTFGNDGLLVVWEFAISDFDVFVHPHNEKSIRMLRSRGLDFNFHRIHGINSQILAQSMIQIGLLSGKNTQVQWVTFHGSYDFGYLIKAITKRALPKSLAEFKIIVEQYFGRHVYDVKYMLGFYPYLFGGLEAIAAKVGVHRVLGVDHQAGSDSLLTQMLFQKLKTDYFSDDEKLKKTQGHIFPLSLI